MVGENIEMKELCLFITFLDHRIFTIDLYSKALQGKPKKEKSRNSMMNILHKGFVHEQLLRQYDLHETSLKLNFCF